MSIKQLITPLAVGAVAVGVAVATVAPAGAINNIKPFGTEETIKDYGLSNEIGYTVDNLMPSNDAVPYPVNGDLYESTVTVRAMQGSVMPIVNNFNARARSGHNYRVLTQVSTLSGAGLPPGAESSGKVYFDVVGDTPNSVVFSDAGQDLLGWITP